MKRRGRETSTEPVISWQLDTSMFGPQSLSRTGDKLKASRTPPNLFHMKTSERVSAKKTVNTCQFFLTSKLDTQNVRVIVDS